MHTFAGIFSVQISSSLPIIKIYIILIFVVFPCDVPLRPLGLHHHHVVEVLRRAHIASGARGFIKNRFHLFRISFSSYSWSIFFLFILSWATTSRNNSWYLWVGKVVCRAACRQRSLSISIQRPIRGIQRMILTNVGGGNFSQQLK